MNEPMNEYEKFIAEKDGVTFADMWRSAALLQKYSDYREYFELENHICNYDGTLIDIIKKARKARMH